MLESGRNSLLESAQQATFISVATAALDRQCNKLAGTALSAKIHARRGQNNGVAGRRVPHPRGVFVFAVIGDPATGLRRWGDLGWESVRLPRSHPLY
jgi:hypothetical protein